tara:strand:+ start:390 stop:1220 length:831 start_codon:yes stop_codon:yes gene_type:complete
VIAQSTIVSSELDTTQGYIGDVVNWTVLVDNAENRRIQFPELFLQDDTVSVRTQKLLYNKGIVTGITFELVFWDTGKFQTPAYQVDILNDSDTVISSIAPEPIELTILSLLASTGNSDFRPIKGPVPVRSLFPLRLTVLGILAIFLIACIYWTWSQRVNVKYQRNEYLISKSPREKAIRRLEELNINGFAKDYYAELSHISREYVEYSTFIRALEMTTKEINDNRNLFPINDKMFADWVKTLSIADLVKYARAIPDSTQMDLDHQKIICFIEQSFV